MHPKYFLVLLVLLNFWQANARIGLAETYFSTPGGHSICDCDGLEDSDNAPSIIGFEWAIPRIEKFYFYKGHIIGYSDSLYFIFNEETEYFQLFESKWKWKGAISKAELRPYIRRWLDVGDDPQRWWIVFMMTWWITIPVCIYVFWNFRKFILPKSQIDIFSLLTDKKNLPTAIIGFLCLCWLFTELFWIKSF